MNAKLSKVERDMRIYFNGFSMPLTKSQKAEMFERLTGRKRRQRARYREFLARQVKERSAWYIDEGGDAATVYFNIELDEDELMEEVKEAMWMRTNSPYDCSGRQFTISITYGHMGEGKFRVRHRIGVDV